MTATVSGIGIEVLREARRLAEAGYGWEDLMVMLLLSKEHAQAFVLGQKAVERKIHAAPR